MKDNKVTYDDGVFTGLAEVLNAPEPKDKYTMKVAKNGRTMYFKNGILVAKNKIPEGTIVRDLDTQLSNMAETIDPPVAETATIQTDSVPVEVRKCVFGDGEDEFQRYINGQMIRLCQTHYEMTTGKIVQKLREITAWTASAQ